MAKPEKVFSKTVRVGELEMGGRLPVLVQSMTDVPVADTRATLNQILNLVEKGCDIVRIAVPTVKDIDSLITVKNLLKKAEINIPLVADVHYSPIVAEKAARFVEKVRINPGNYITDKKKQHYSEKDFEMAREQIFENVQPLIKTCLQYGTALRVGVNWGSLSKRILYRYGNTAKGMVVSAMEFVDILLESGFDQFTLSLKASDVRVMQEANVMLVKEMIKQDKYFPLHLGVTEAGDGFDARIKSAAGIGALLKLGVGDTVRVSLTEKPENEIPVARKLLAFSNKGVKPDELEKLHFHLSDKTPVEGFTHNKPLIISEKDTINTDLVLKNNKLFIKATDKPVKIDKDKVLVIKSDEKNKENFVIKSSVLFAYAFLKQQVQAVLLRNKFFKPDELLTISLDLLQGTGLRYSKTEYIACPSCGRTRFDVKKQLSQIKKQLSSTKTLKIAVMGCSVNGPGEMADADYGYVGSSKGKVTLYKRGKVIHKNIPEEMAASKLKAMIEKYEKL